MSSQPGIFTVKGVADGRDVEARVEVCLLEAELPVVKKIAFKYRPYQSTNLYLTYYQMVPSRRL